MESAPATDPSLSGVLEELKQREPIFHRHEFGNPKSVFERMTAEDFWEVGASGRRYSRDAVQAELERRSQTEQAEVWETEGFHCRRLSPDTYLLTYSLLQNHTRKTRRTTIWQQTADGWKILYHQGTLVQDFGHSAHQGTGA